MGLGIALKAFTAALFDSTKADQISRVLAGETVIALEAPKTAESTVAESKAAAKPEQMTPTRDSAITLLASLQREARWVDLVQEDLQQYSDAQVGAAARPCLQQCSEVLSRMFQIKPLVNSGEGSMVPVAQDASPLRYQWVGEGTSSSGKLIHHGWQASKIELPQWSGDSADAKVIAAAQVEAV